MEEKLVNSEEDAINWFGSLTKEEQQEVIFKIKNAIIAERKIVPDKIKFTVDGDKVNIISYEKGNQ